jgi:gas vesicle protein GvpA/GvpJ/GvpM family
MTTGNIVQPGAGAAQNYGGGGSSGYAPSNLADILERVLDKGIVIAGDIQVNLLDIELLTIKLRLVIASLDTARDVGINWWETDPWLSADAGRRVRAREQRELDDPSARELQEENERLQDRIRELEAGRDGDDATRRRPSSLGNDARRRRRTSSESRERRDD